MKICSRCCEQKPFYEFSSHKLTRDGLRGECKICHAKETARWKKENPDKHKAQQKRHGKKYNSQINLKSRIRYGATLEYQRARKSAYKKLNRGKENALLAKYRATKKMATPPWLTALHFQQIEIFYDAAAKLTKEFGVKMDVDHIIPIQGEIVCGLHVPWNLQILTAKENQSKGNRI